MNLLTLHRRLDPNNPIRRVARAMRPNARLLATAGYWMMTPHKIPARIAFIRQLTSKNEQLLALNAERAAKIEQLSKPSAMDRPLAFMHIPKTSGIALTNGLREVLPSTTVHRRLRPSALRCVPFIRDHVSRTASNQIYEALPPAKGIDFVAGHMAYSTLIQSRPAARFMTVLREPRSRILSLWMFWRSTRARDPRSLGCIWARPRPGPTSHLPNFSITRKPPTRPTISPSACCYGLILSLPMTASSTARRTSAL